MDPKLLLKNYLEERRTAREQSIKGSLKCVQSSSELRMKHQQKLSERAEFRYNSQLNHLLGIFFEKHKIIY